MRSFAGEGLSYSLKGGVHAARGGGGGWGYGWRVGICGGGEVGICDNPNSGIQNFENMGFLESPCEYFPYDVFCYFFVF